MLAKRVIPCLDVKDGRVVKGIGFSNLRDAGDAVKLASYYNQQGADELAFLDINASHEGRSTILGLLSQVADTVFIPLTAGGGVRTAEEVGQLLRSGADKVSINTAAVLRPQILTEAATAFGSQCVVLAIDAKRGPGGRWRVYTRGGRCPTNLDVEEWAVTGVELGAGELLLTSMGEDGRQSGYELELTRTVSQAVSVPVIASGGAGGSENVVEVLSSGLADAALLASQLHYGYTTISNIKRAMVEAGLPTRLV